MYYGTIHADDITNLDIRSMDLATLMTVADELEPHPLYVEVPLPLERQDFITSL